MQLGNISSSSNLNYAPKRQRKADCIKAGVTYVILGQALFMEMKDSG